MKDPRRSGGYHVDDAHAHEHLACRCLDLLTRPEPVLVYGSLMAQQHPTPNNTHVHGGPHTSLLPIQAPKNFGICSLGSAKIFGRLVAVKEKGQDQSIGLLIVDLPEAREACFSWVIFLFCFFGWWEVC